MKTRGNSRKLQKTQFPQFSPVFRSFSQFFPILQLLTLGSFSDWVDIQILPSRQAGFPVTVCSAASFSLRGCRVPSKALFTAKQLTLFGSFPNCSFKASRRKKRKKRSLDSSPDSSLIAAPFQDLKYTDTCHLVSRMLRPRAEILFVEITWQL